MYAGEKSIGFAGHMRRMMIVCPGAGEVRLRRSCYEKKTMVMRDHRDGDSPWRVRKRYPKERGDYDLG